MKGIIFMSLSLLLTMAALSAVVDHKGSPAPTTNTEIPAYLQ